MGRSGMMFWLVAAGVASAPVASSPSAHELLLGASHAIRVDRLDQAAVMVSRALAAGASGWELDRTLADLAYSSGKYSEALDRYEALLKIRPDDATLIEPAAIAALKLDLVNQAASLLSLPASRRSATWSLWNARGVAADLKQEWAVADESYARAASLAPGKAAPMNNHGWSLILRGDWSHALDFFEQALVLDPKSERIADNCELARMAIAGELPQRRPGESNSSWAARLNDAGVAAAIRGDKSRATAAFTRAIDVNGTWYERAANNLDALGRP